MNDNKTPSYWDYLKLDGLLSLQGGLTGDEADVSPDELHFIIVHQCYELWFKGVLAELRAARDILLVDPVPESEIPSADKPDAVVINVPRRRSRKPRPAAQPGLDLESVSPREASRRAVPGEPTRS